jgi:hypothetical protein
MNKQILVVRTSGHTHTLATVTFCDAEAESVAETLTQDVPSEN